MSIKSIILTFLVLVSTACSRESPVLTSALEVQVEGEVKQAFENLIAAAKTLEVAPYLSHFDEETFTAMLDGEVLLSFEEFEAMYTEQAPALKAYLSLEFDKVEVTVLDLNAAILVNAFNETIVLASGDTLSLSGAGSQVWRRKSTEWKLIHISGGIKSTS